MKLAPIVDELADEFAGRAKVVKIDAHANFDTSVEYAIRALPQVFIFKDGQPVEQVGYRDKGDLVALIEKHL